MRPKLGAPLLASVVAFSLCLALAGCVDGGAQNLREPAIAGQRIVVWDSEQPEMVGVSSYSDLVQEAIAEFSALYGVEVQRVVVSRQAIADYLLGEGEGFGSEEGPASDPPALIFTTERPFLSGLCQRVEMLEQEGEYLETALNYWREDQEDREVMAIPSYVSWISTAIRPQVDGPTVYMPGSPEFLAIALGQQPCLAQAEGLGESEKIMAFCAWMKQKYGLAQSDPLGAWLRGEAAAFYGVNPYLLRWLESEGDFDVVLAPVDAPFGEPEFYLTAPGYMVLAKHGPEKRAAALLGRCLAANLGRWAARALGCVPAFAADVAIFNLESPLKIEERSSLLQAIVSSLDHPSKAPYAGDYSSAKALEEVCAKPIEGFFFGEMDEERLASLIQQAVERHTKP